MSDHRTLPYRPGVGVMLANPQGLVFVGQRIDSTLDAWQMPQGGVDKGEDWETAALRELEEETGIAPALVQIAARTREPLRYDLPPELIGQLWKGRYRGQEQHWYLMRFLGSDSDVNIATRHPEFRAWRWMAADQLEPAIVPFKRALYRAVVAELTPHI